MGCVPAAHLQQKNDAQQGCEPEPGDAMLAERHDHCRRDEGSDGGAGVAAHLEHRLRHAVLAAGCQARDAR